jgi:hypothetical protein
MEVGKRKFSPVMSEFWQPSDSVVKLSRNFVQFLNIVVDLFSHYGSVRLIIPDRPQLRRLYSSLFREMVSSVVNITM